MTRHLVWFSSAEEVTVHIEGCPSEHHTHGENVVQVWIEIDDAGSLPTGMRHCGNCGDKLEQRAKRARGKLAAKIREGISKYNKPSRWFR